MAKSSVNISDDKFFTIDWYDETAYIGELDGDQKHLVELTKEEFVNLVLTLNKFIDYAIEEDAKAEKILTFSGLHWKEK